MAFGEFFDKYMWLWTKNGQMIQSARRRSEILGLRMCFVGFAMGPSGGYVHVGGVNSDPMDEYNAFFTVRGLNIIDF